MPEHDPCVLAYSHLHDFPRAPEALHILRRVASLVKPLMRARRWTVAELAEFYPDQPNLLGLNINKGQRILLRLRYPGGGDACSLFLPLDQVADTLLHELAHIVHGPHDEVFHALWNQLRDEHMALMLKGYTGEGFLGEGRRVGDSSRSSGRTSSSRPSGPTYRNITLHEARRMARQAAERRRAEQAAILARAGAGPGPSSGGGHRLGGTAPMPGFDIRRVLADAVGIRHAAPPFSYGPSTGPSFSGPSFSGNALSGSPLSGNTPSPCATTGRQYDDQARRALAEQATRNGFRTQAEEDAANDAAIAQALWELVQEDERDRLGPRYREPTAEHPGGRIDERPVTDMLMTPAIVVSSDDDDDDDYDDYESRRHGSHSHNRRPSFSSRRQSAPPPPSPPPAPVQYASSPSRPPPPPPPPPRRRTVMAAGSPPVSARAPPPPSPPASSSSSATLHGWTCPACTLHNPGGFLCCDACGTIRPGKNNSISNGHRYKGKERATSGHGQSSSQSQPPSSSLSRSRSLFSKSSSARSAEDRPTPLAKTKRHSTLMPSASLANAVKEDQRGERLRKEHKEHKSKKDKDVKKDKSKKDKDAKKDRRVTWTPSTTSRYGMSGGSGSGSGSRSRNSVSSAGASSKTIYPRGHGGSSGSAPSGVGTRTAGPHNVGARVDTWTCSFCGRAMEDRWWTCDLCGKIKEDWQVR